MPSKRLASIDYAISAVVQLRQEALQLEAEFAADLERIPADYRDSGCNLLHYLGVRRHDIRDLQRHLSRLGLSSLGRLEAHAMASLQAVLEALHRLGDREVPSELTEDLPVSFARGYELLADHTIAILGAAPRHRNARIMVTMPSEAADDPAIARTLVAAGMDIARINCAHDGPEQWERMVHHLRAAALACARPCRFAFDLAGPKFRTGSIPRAADALTFPERKRAIVLEPGDTLILVPETHVPDTMDSSAPPAIGCLLPEVFHDARPGDRIFFDDGKLGGTIRNVAPTRIEVEIGLAAKGKVKLRSEKGINLPDTNLSLPALTDKDRADLEFVARYGDMVALSFLRRPEDIEDLVRELHRLEADRLGIVLKIETRQAFERLPRLLLVALQHPPVAVMVARGDLGVEIGFERLSEVQEEILWLCEAAHVPSIWATQVLESLAKGGLPSRAEVTDAAMAGRAECVMLNKGPYIDRTLRFLCDVLERMQRHQEKKSSMLRKLNVSDLAEERSPFPQ